MEKPSISASGGTAVSSAQKSQLKAAFKFFDANGNSVLDDSELKSVLRAMGT